MTWILEASVGGDVSFIRAFRALRALRPLRVIARNEGMKTVVDALLKSIPALFNVLLIVLSQVIFSTSLIGKLIDFLVFYTN